MYRKNIAKLSQWNSRKNKKFHVIFGFNRVRLIQSLRDKITYVTRPFPNGKGKLFL